MRKIYIPLVFSLICLNLLPYIAFSQTVNSEEIKTVARKFYFERLQNTEKIPFNNIQLSEIHTKYDDGLPLYHICEMNKGGYVIVSASKRTTPVLAYSFDAPIFLDNSAPGFDAWMAFYGRQIKHAEQNSITPSDGIEDEWLRLTNSSLSDCKDISGQKSVLPLISSRWNQSNFYNGMCPQDPDGPGGRAYAGCVATAMGQLLYYHRWPITGTGSYAYNHPVYGTIQTDFANTTFDWDDMPNQISRPNHAIAELLFSLGVSVDMNYGPNGSGMWNHSAARSMRNYFKYCPETEYIFRDSTTLAWDSIIIANLDAHKPLYYAGWTVDPADSSGHAFVCDGYQGFDYFHFDWGWGGSFNGYFYLNNLSPGGADFNFRQELIKDIYPDTINETYPLYCASPKVLTDIVGSIEDGSGILDYQNNASCAWLIEPELNVTNIKLLFNKLDTEQNKDLIRIYNGNSTASPLVGTYSGSTIPNEITINGKKAYVTFTSDDSITSGGFCINYTASVPVYCTAMQTLTAPNGTFGDGSNQYPYNYLTNCRWRITPPGAENITITFTNFNVDSLNDVVEIWDMSSSPATVIDTYTGSIMPAAKTYSSANLMVWFKTNTFEPKSGWELQYQASLTDIQNTDDMQVLFNIYPNPSNEKVYVDFSALQTGLYTVEVITLSGSTVFAYSTSVSATGQDVQTLDLPQLPSGLYIVKLSTPLKSFYKKLILY